MADLAKAGTDGVRAGALPVTVAAAGPTARSTGSPQRVSVEVLDRPATERAGVQGVVMRLGRADGVAAAGHAKLTLDYRSFATAYGADWASRLRLVALPACALTTPEKQQCAGTPLPSRNDLATRSLTAEVSVSGAQTLVAAAAGSSGPAGDYAASPLNPSATWAAGGNTGALHLVVPDADAAGPGRPGAPDRPVVLLAVGRRPACRLQQPAVLDRRGLRAVNRRVHRAPVQAVRSTTWTARPTTTSKTGDLCWATDNATLPSTATPVS